MAAWTHKAGVKTKEPAIMCIEEQKEIAEQIAANLMICTKSVLTTEEAARYMGVSKSYLYKLTMRQEIPHYKAPNGRICYFNRVELENWMQSNRITPKDEIAAKAQSYCASRKGI